MINCCNGCVPPKRHVGCHATCEDYISEKKKHEETRAKIQKERKKENEFCEYIIRKINRRKQYINKR